MRKQISFKLLLIITILCLSSCSSAQNNKNVKDSSDSTKSEKEALSKIENLLKKQILLTNHAQFTNSRNLTGASGFLIKYQNENFAVTARHLLGEAGGIQPEVKINELEKNLLNWEMSPRVVSNAEKETVKLSVKGLGFSDSTDDVVLFKITSNTFDLGVLTPKFDLPSIGENLFLIGCPYSERQCKQNYYKVTFVEFLKAEGLLFGEISSDVNLAGFSGAPLVNSNGEIIGILKGGGEYKEKFYISATPIKTIQKIKF